MKGTIAVTDSGWYRHMLATPGLEEVNFWKPSAHRAFSAPEFSPFLFKLKAPHNAICGFGYFARYAALPDWLAWDTFGAGNGCASLREMRDRVAEIRRRIGFTGPANAEIGCILLVQPHFFRESDWIAQPVDWPGQTLSDKRYDLESGEGARVWNECIARAAYAVARDPGHFLVAKPNAPRYGTPALVAPRLGQGTFRIAVTEAYARSCAISGEHSLPALEAAHIRSYTADGPHDVRNGLLLRADLHRLFDQGYLTVSPDFRVEVSERLRAEFQNGRSYYPFHGQRLRVPSDSRLQPEQAYLAWHREHALAT